MKRILLSLLLTLSLVVSGQVKKAVPVLFDWWSNSGAISSGQVSSFANVSYTHKVWRVGSSPTLGEITVPAGYSNPTWYIIQTQAPYDTVATGTTKTVSNTFTFDLNYKVVYDLAVRATRSGYPPVNDIYPGEFTILPALFTEGQADVVIDVSTGSMVYADSHTARSTLRRVFVKGPTYTGANNLQVLWVNHTNSTQPLHLLFSPGTQIQINTTNAFGARVGADVRNVIIDGAGSESIQYGAKITMTDGSGAQMLYIEGADGSSTLAQASKNLVIVGMDFEANNFGSSITVQNTNTVAVNYDNYSFEGLVLKGLRIKNSVDESFYIGHFTDALIGGRAYAGILKALIFDCIGMNAGRENGQFGSLFLSKIFKNWFENGGGLNDVNHQNEVQFSEGNQDLDFFMNVIRGTRNIFSGFVGRRGSNVEVHANTIYSTGRDADGVNLFVRMDQNDTYSSVNWAFYNNSIRTSTYLLWELWNAAGSPTTTFNKMIIADNLLSSDVTTVYNTNNGINTTNFQITNNQITTTPDDYLYFNLGNKDLRLGSRLSPAFTSRTSFTKASRYGNHDFNGHAFMTSNPAIGAYSGFEHYTGSQIVKNVVSVESVSDITVAHGTPFASTGLPSKILATLSDGSTRAITLSWNQGSYNASVAATYAVTGTLTLPSDITNSGSVTASANLIVQAALPPVSANININTGTATNWVSTGSGDPFGTVDYGQMGTTGIGLRTNSTGGTWNSRFSNGATTGNNSGIYPDAILGTGWYVSGTTISRIELYNHTGTPLTGRIFTITVLGSKQGVSALTTQYRINGGTWQTLNCLNNTANVVTFTNITPISGVITIEVQATTPNANSEGYLNGLTIQSQ